MFSYLRQLKTWKQFWLKMRTILTDGNISHGNWKWQGPAEFPENSVAEWEFNTLTF